MSMGSEYLSEIAAENAHREHCLAQGLWVTRDGREIPLAELSNKHLASIIRMMARGRVFHGPKGDVLEMLAEEAIRRGMKPGSILQETGRR